MNTEQIQRGKQKFTEYSNHIRYTQNSCHELKRERFFPILQNNNKKTIIRIKLLIIMWGGKEDVLRPRFHVSSV